MSSLGVEMFKTAKCKAKCDTHKACDLKYEIVSFKNCFTNRWKSDDLTFLFISSIIYK